jgi:hypothetical protein
MVGAATSFLLYKIAVQRKVVKEDIQNETITIPVIIA